MQNIHDSVLWRRGIREETKYKSSGNGFKIPIYILCSTHGPHSKMILTLALTVLECEEWDELDLIQKIGGTIF